jgi:DNA primase
VAVIIYRGRTIDPVALWSEFTEIPDNKKDDTPFIHGLWCPNPEHQNSRKPGPFQINVTQPTVHCFAECGISGSYERAITVVTGCTAKEARRRLLEHSRVSAPTGSKRKRMGGTSRRIKSADLRIVSEVDSLAYDSYVPQYGLDYLRGRGISGDSVARWNLGWDADERRIVIPAADINGTVRFLIKRAVREKDWPKYLYLPEGCKKTSLLFGACMLDRDRVRSHGLVVVEGSVDTIWLHQLDVTYAAGVLGSHLSSRQRDIIAKFRPPRIYWMVDKDAAGVRLMLHGRRDRPSGTDMLKKYPQFVCLYPKDKSDPDELTREEVYRSIERAVPLPIFRQRLPNRNRYRRVTASS